MDHFNTKIEIGGPITEAELTRIAEFAAMCNLSCDYESQYVPEWIEERLRDQLKRDDVYLVVCDPALVHEGWDTLTKFLRQQHIPYNIRVDASDEFDADLKWWRVGMKQEASWPCMDKDAVEVMVSRSYLQRALRRRMTLKNLVKRLENIPHKMEEAYLVEVGKHPTTSGVKRVDGKKVKS